MKTIYSIMAFAALCVAITISSIAPAEAQSGLGIDQSSSGGQIMNPYPGEQILDKQPMIGVKLPDMLQELANATSAVKVNFFFDGSEVSGEAQISVDYIFYVPAVPLKLGTHNIRITYKLLDLTNGAETDITGLPPIAWSFTVVAKLDRPVAPVYNPNEKPSTTGRVYLNYADVNLFRNPATVDTDVKYHEAPTLSGTYDFTHKFYGKTLTGHYERYYEELTARPNDYFLFHYLDTDDDVYAGDFPITTRDFSELTISGVRLRGVMSIKPLNPKYKLTTLAGRSMEPQGYFKRKTIAAKIDTKITKNDSFRITIVDSTENGVITSTATVPKSDQILGLKNSFKYNNKLTLDSMTNFNNHSENGVTGKVVLNKDFAYRNVLTYKSKRVETTAGRRTIGPSYNPTTIGAYTEADREGSYGTFKYKPSQRFNLETFYDAYHNNVRHVQTRVSANTLQFLGVPDTDLTDKSKNSISSLMLSYPQLPRLSMRYSKLYTKTDTEKNVGGTNDSETTSAMLMMNKSFNDFLLFNNPTLITNFTRSDNDSKSLGTGAGATTNNSSVRTDLRSYTFTAAYKSFAQMNFTTSKSNSLSWTLTTMSDTRSNSDAVGVQLNIVPFKFITNLNYRRQASRTVALVSGGIASNSVTAAPLETQHIITFIYYMSNKKKLNLDIENYDKSYRTDATAAKSYVEKVVRLGYTLDF